MKRSVLISILILLVILLPFSNILFTGSSFYSPVGFIYCKEAKDCRHEVGHLIDHDLGDVSKKEEFGGALLLQLIVQVKMGGLDDMGKRIVTFPGILTYSELYKPYHLEAGSSPQQELYADLYARADGDIDKIPEALKPFYSDDPYYDKVYDHLVTHKFYFDTRRFTK